MLVVPANVLKSWPTPNYNDPPRRGKELWIFSAIFLFAATVSVSVRLWARIFVRRFFGLDDLLIVLAFVCLDVMMIRFRN
jgi:hypothetical protein